MTSKVEKVLLLSLTEDEALLLYDGLIKGYKTDDIKNFKNHLETLLLEFQNSGNLLLSNKPNERGL